jgi:hypothetical protein
LARAATPQLCDAGTHSNATGLVSADGCTPVEAGFWAPAGSTEAIACKSSVLLCAARFELAARDRLLKTALPLTVCVSRRCPGRAADEKFRGGQPIIIEGGASIQTVTRTELVTVPEIVTVPEMVTEVQTEVQTVTKEEEKWSVSATITLEQNPETYNETAVRLELAALYGVPLSWIQLNATAGSLVLAVTIAPPPSALAASASGVAAVSAADVAAAVDAADAATLSQALNATAALTQVASIAVENVSVAYNISFDRNVSFERNVTVQRNVTRSETVTVVESVDCEPGHFSPGSGICLPCAPGSVAPNAGSSTCSSCAPGSYQDSQGKIACIGCPVASICEKGSAGFRACPAGRFSNQPRLGSADECAPCPRGHVCSSGSTAPKTCRLDRDLSQPVPRS